jgi:hypothetical protein
VSCTYSGIYSYGTVSCTYSGIYSYGTVSCTYIGVSSLVDRTVCSIFLDLSVKHTLPPARLLMINDIRYMIYI